MVFAMEYYLGILNRTYDSMSRDNSSDYSEVHAILKQLYANPQSLEEWAILAELFLDLGEKAQEYYSGMYIRNLMVFERNGG